MPNTPEAQALIKKVMSNYPGMSWEEAYYIVKEEMYPEKGAYPEREARRGRWPGSDPDERVWEGWDGKIYTAGAEGEPDTVFAEGLSTGQDNPVHFTPQDIKSVLPPILAETIRGVRMRAEDKKKAFKASRRRNFRGRAFDYPPQWRQDEQE